MDVDALAVYPHAHYVGKDPKAGDVLPDGTKKPLVWIKDWDLNWQAIYRYERAVFLPPGRLSRCGSPTTTPPPTRATRTAAETRRRGRQGHGRDGAPVASGIAAPAEDARMVLQEALSAGG